jgi:hypothetical protein
MSRVNPMEVSTQRLRHVLFLFASAVVAGAGCAGADSGGFAPDAPRLYALSDYEQSVGEPIQFLGEKFCNTSDCATYMQFKGNCRLPNGSLLPVQMYAAPSCTSPSTCTWRRFGPLANPFTGSPQLGTFVGEICPITRAEGSDPKPGPCLGNVEFAVKPGLMIRKLRPLRSTCDAPVKRLLSDFAYELEVEAVGFTPVSFSYNISRLDDDPGSVSTISPSFGRGFGPNQALNIQHTATGQVDGIGADGSWIVPAFADDSLISSRMVVSIVATGSQGESYSLLLPFSVHRPLDFRMKTTPELAEVYDPEVEDGIGCIGGGETSTNKNFTISKTKSIDISKSTQFDETQLQSVTNGQSASKTEGKSINMSRSTSNSTEFGWQTNHDTNHGWNFQPNVQILALGGSLGGFNGNRSDSSGDNGSTSTSNTDTVANETSSSSTESLEQSRTQGINRSMGGSGSISMRTDLTVSQGMEVLIPARRAAYIYRQLQRWTQPVDIFVYDLCDGETRVGTVARNLYKVGGEVAMGEACAPAPQPPTLKRAQCFISPCDNGR